MTTNPIEELRQLSPPVSEQEWSAITSDRRYVRKFGRKGGMSPKGRAALVACVAAVFVTLPVLFKTLNHNRTTSTATETAVPTTATHEPATPNSGQLPSSTIPSTPEKDATSPAKVATTAHAASHERSTLTDVIEKRNQIPEDQNREDWPPVLCDPTTSHDTRLTPHDIKVIPGQNDTTGLQILNARVTHSRPQVAKVEPNDNENSVTVDVEEMTNHNHATSEEPSPAADQVFIPSAFTPNGDGLNDLFVVKANFEPRSYELSVFNRHGDLVFITRDINTGWDGKQHGKTLQQGMYVYVIRYLDSSGNEQRHQGQILLIQ